MLIHTRNGDARTEAIKEASIFLEMVLNPEKIASAVVSSEKGYYDLREGGLFKSGKIPEGVRVVEGRRGFSPPHLSEIPVEFMFVADSAKDGSFKIYIYRLNFDYSDKSLDWEPYKCIHYAENPNESGIYDLVNRYSHENSIQSILATVREVNADVSLDLTSIYGNGYAFSNSMFEKLFVDILDNALITFKQKGKKNEGLIVPELRDDHISSETFLKKWGPLFKYLNIVINDKIERLDFLYLNGLERFFDELFDGDIFSENIDLYCNQDSIYESLRGMDEIVLDVLINYPWLQSFKTYQLLDRMIKAGGFDDLPDILMRIESMHESSDDEKKKEFLSTGNKYMRVIKKRA